jgi:hypothetical protein
MSQPQLDITERITVDQVLTKVPQNLEEVIVPDTVTILGQYAFAGSSVRTVTLPSSLRIVEEGALSSCRWLKRIELPYGLKEIGYGALSRCPNLEYVLIPDSVTEFGNDVFSNSKNIKLIIAPIHLITKIRGQTGARLEVYSYRNSALHD